jgi:hypothetical protein
MRKQSVFSSVFAVLALAIMLTAAQDKIEFKTIDGVTHVFNPAKPLKGTIKLEVERTRTIDPYEQSEVGMKWFYFNRDEQGGVILFDPNGAEGHRFGPAGEYLGLLTKKGQGPGEFSPMQGYYVYRYGTDFWVFGGQKVACFDGRGKLVKDRVLKNSFDASVDADRFFATSVVWNEKREGLWTLKLVAFDMGGAETATDLLQAANIKMIRNPNGQGSFGETWATPNFVFAADPSQKLTYYALNTKYEIRVGDYSGKVRLVIRKEHENVKAKRGDVAKMMAWAGKEERTKWMLSAYPDRFVAFKDLLSMPKGHLAAYRVTGPEQFEIDVFSPKGEYLYALIPPLGPDFNRALFFSTGFGTVESSGDSFVYREYRIKNLPEIFGK